MAAAVVQPYNVIQNLFSLPASGDLSTKQYYFADINSDGQVAVAGAGSTAIGVIQNAPAAAGRACDVQCGSITPIVCGGSITAGGYVKSDASGLAVAASSGDKALGRILGTGATGLQVSMIFQPCTVA